VDLAFGFFSFSKNKAKSHMGLFNLEKFDMTMTPNCDVMFDGVALRCVRF